MKDLKLIAIVAIITAIIGVAVLGIFGCRTVPHSLAICALCAIEVIIYALTNKEKSYGVSKELGTAH